MSQLGFGLGDKPLEGRSAMPRVKISPAFNAAQHSGLQSDRKSRLSKHKSNGSGRDTLQLVWQRQADGNLLYGYQFYPVQLHLSCYLYHDCIRNTTLFRYNL